MLIKALLVTAAVIGAITVIVVENRPLSPTPLRQPTATERKLLDSMTSVAPKARGGMH